MFGPTSRDVEQWLMMAHDAARTECKFNQYEMARKMAVWIGQDRRFDGIKEKQAFAREVMDCRRSGRELDLTKRMGTGATGPAGYISRNV
jgi:hypothetical protein